MLEELKKLLENSSKKITVSYSVNSASCDDMDTEEDKGGNK